MVASGRLEAKRKGLDDRVKISYVVKGPAKLLTLFTFSRGEWEKLREVVGWVGFERDFDMQQRTAAMKLAMEV